MHRNVEEITRSNCSSEIWNELGSYREVQLLFTLYNNTHKVLVTGNVVWLLIFTNTIFSYLVVVHYQDLDAFSLMVSVSMIPTSYVSLFALIVPGSVHSTSLRVHQRISYLFVELVKQNCARSKLSELRRYWMSCQKMKICLFSDNFFDSETPLSLVNFCVNNTATLILMQ